MTAILDKVSRLLQRFRVSSTRGSVPPQRSLLTYQTKGEWAGLGVSLSEVSFAFEQIGRLMRGEPLLWIDWKWVEARRAQGTVANDRSLKHTPLWALNYMTKTRQEGR